MQRPVIITRQSLNNLKVLVAALPAIVAGTGCYQYQSSTLAAVHPGQVVHVELTTPGAASLGSAIGTNAASIDGRVLMRDATSVTLAVTQIARTAGPEEFLRDEPIALPLESAQRVTVRSVDRPRSFFAAGGVVLGAILAAAFVDQSAIFSAKGGPSGSTK
ncbi:MAG: hypothetical protein JWM41_188 [Gemmatimonadetes bacterium]|nr:hypothetical protein [Gemmatimonadota bacterium]